MLVFATHYSLFLNKIPRIQEWLVRTCRHYSHQSVHISHLQPNFCKIFALTVVISGRISVVISFDSVPVNEEGLWHGRRLITFLRSTNFSKFLPRYTYTREHSMNRDTIWTVNWKISAYANPAKETKLKIENKKRTHVHSWSNLHAAKTRYL